MLAHGSYKIKYENVKYKKNFDSNYFHIKCLETEIKF